MSSVDNAKKIIKLLCDSEKFVSQAIANKSSGIAADIALAIPLIEEAIVDVPAFSLALAELKALDAQGIADLVSELAADLVFDNPKVEGIIKAVLEFLPPMLDLVKALKA